MTIGELNEMPKDEATDELLACCGSTKWVQEMVKARPYADLDALIATADRVWSGLSKEDWLEAFASHPEIGDPDSFRSRRVHTRKWANEEQSGASSASETVLAMLKEGNRRYKARFDHTFIVFASGKSAPQMLRLLKERMKNDPAEELEIAAVEQQKITRLRLQKLIDDATSK